MQAARPKGFIFLLHTNWESISSWKQIARQVSVCFPTVLARLYFQIYSRARPSISQFRSLQIRRTTLQQLLKSPISWFCSFKTEKCSIRKFLLFVSIWILCWTKSWRTFVTCVNYISSWNLVGRNPGMSQETRLEHFTASFVYCGPKCITCFWN